MAVSDSLDHSVQLLPININAKCEILNQLWDLNVSPEKYYENDLQLQYDIYFAYYSEQCSIALYDGGRHVLVRTHRDVVDIAQRLKGSKERGTIKGFLRSKLDTPKPANENEILDGSIDLVSRLLLMIEIGSLQYGFTGRRQLAWTSGSLRDFVHAYFNGPQALGRETVKLEKIFNARDLGRIAGMKIAWTTNLAGHLRLTDDDEKTVAIFHQASFLECQLKKYDIHTNSNSRVQLTQIVLCIQMD